MKDYPVLTTELKAQIIIREMIRWAQEVPKGATHAEVALGALMTHLESSLPKIFYNKTAFTKTTEENIRRDCDIHLAQAINNLMLMSWGRFADVCKIVDELTAEQAKDMYVNKLPVRPYKEQKPITTEVKFTKPKKISQERHEANIQAFLTAGMNNSTK